VTLLLARVRDGIRDLMSAAGAEGLVERHNFSVDDAVTRAYTLATQPSMDGYD